jgi:hypothetical protein
MEGVNVMSVPVKAPQSYPYRFDNFFVRPCYQEYYDEIMDRFSRSAPLTINYISITGTPGIGKSVFYLYFLNKYRFENPEKSVITASFGKSQDLKDCQLFRPNGIVEKCRDTNGKPIIPEFDTVSWPKDIICDLYLYDGPPNQPPLHFKMIAFTSPNFTWLEAMRKEQSHSRLYMPNWDLIELFHAQKALGLNIDEEEIQRRYAVFGGSPRYCLSMDDEYIKEGEEEITKAIETIRGFNELKKLFHGIASEDKVVHCLMNYIPRENPRFADLVPASLSISLRLRKQLDTRLTDMQLSLMGGSKEASPFSGWLLEGFVHKHL